MGLGNPMGQLGTVLVFEDERLLALDDQNDGPGRLPALEQIRLRTIVTPRHQPRRPRRLRGGQGAGPARPEDRLTGVDLTGEHEEQSAGDSLDAPGAHRPILVSDEQRHVRHVSRPVFEAIVAALGFHDQERVHRSQSQAPLPRHGLPPAYRPRFTLAGGGERGLQVYGIGPQALVGLGCQGRRDPGMSARGEVERLHGRSPASYLRMVLIFRRRLCLAERDSNVPASSHTGIVPDEVTGPTRSGSSAIRPSSNLSLIRSSSRSAPPPCSPPPPPPLPRSRRILGSTWGVNTAPPAGASAHAHGRQAPAFSRAMRWTAPGFGDLARRVLRRDRSASGAAGAAPGSFHADRLAAKHRCPPLFLGRRRPRDLRRSHWTEPGSPARTDSAA